MEGGEIECDDGALTIWLLISILLPIHHKLLGYGEGLDDDVSDVDGLLTNRHRMPRISLIKGVVDIGGGLGVGCHNNKSTMVPQLINVRTFHDFFPC
jgi:hypothetical protein